MSEPNTISANGKFRGAIFGEKNGREFQLKLISSIDVWQTLSSLNEAPEEPIT